MWLFELFFFLNSANLIWRGTDISKYFIESFGIRDNESGLYIAMFSGPLQSCQSGPLGPNGPRSGGHLALIDLKGIKLKKSETMRPTAYILSM